MIPPHLFEIYISLLESDDCTTPKCEELYSAHTEVENISLTY